MSHFQETEHSLVEGTDSCLQYCFVDKDMRKGLEMVYILPYSCHQYFYISDACGRDGEGFWAAQFLGTDVGSPFPVCLLAIRGTEQV